MRKLNYVFVLCAILSCNNSFGQQDTTTTSIKIPSISLGNNTEASFGADIVSTYIWRGQHLADLSIQPYLDINWKGLEFCASGSVGVKNDEIRDLDLYLGYNIGDFSFGITDYWTAEPGKPTDYFTFSKNETSHVIEAYLGYDFGPLAISWYTNLFGADGCDSEGNRAYSSYCTLTAPFKFATLEWEAELGICPWRTDYYEEVDNFSVCDISVTTHKEIFVDVMGKIGFNPVTQNAYFVIGLSF